MGYLPATEKQERERYVAAALDYCGTPYHHMGTVKGPNGGVDCATILLEAGADAGLVARETLPYYAQHWHQHQTDELYLATILKWTSEAEPPALPGDIAIWKFGHTFSHAAIVVDWPTIVHAVVGRVVTVDNLDNAIWLKYEHHNRLRPMKLFSHWPR
jgi:cell wall-associated NlpC family hydrolase